MAGAREVVVLSGKGGAGKTAVTAAFAALAQNAVLVDADVDAANLALLLQAEESEQHALAGRPQAVIDRAQCTGCGACRRVCRFAAISTGFMVDVLSCEGCGYCRRVCPATAISMHESTSSTWYRAATPCGPLFHARLAPGGENSGKLVQTVRSAARALAAEVGRTLILIDGPPGMGCPVMASLSQTQLAVLVVEPGRAARHDADRVLALAAHMRVPVVLLLNKYGLTAAQETEAWAQSRQLPVAGRIPFDERVAVALAAGNNPLTAAAVAEAFQAAWQQVTRQLPCG